MQVRLDEFQNWPFSFLWLSHKLYTGVVFLVYSEVLFKDLSTKYV